MSATYDSTLPTNMDFVRFLIGDTNINSPKLSDEEITAVLSEETSTGKSLKYFAAASCLGVLLSQWGSAGNGILEKEVDDLRIRWGVESSGRQAIEMRIKELRRQGSFYLRKSPRPFKVLSIILSLLLSPLTYAQSSSLLTAAGWCPVIKSSNSESSIGCDVGLGIRLAPIPVHNRLSLAGVVGTKTIGLGIAYTIKDSNDNNLSYSIAIGVISPYDSQGIYSDNISLALGTNIGLDLSGNQ